MSRRRGPQGFTLLELLIACALMAVLALLSWRGLDAILQTRARLNLESDELRSMTLALAQMDEDLVNSGAVRMLKLGQPEVRVQISGENNAQSLLLLREVSRTGLPTRVQQVVYEVRGGTLARGFSEWQTATLDETQRSAVGTLVWQPILGRVREIRFRGWLAGTPGPAGAPVAPGAPGAVPNTGRSGWLDAPVLAQQLAAIQQSQAAAKAAALAARVSAQAGAPAGGQPQARDRRPGPNPAPVTPVTASTLFVNGIELTLTREDGQRFTRIFSVAD